VEAALFFSPAVHWISRVVRETREYCCDDAAVRWCGEDKSGYVRALTGLAALGSRNRAQPALGAAGPRLITRVRRLLSEERMTRTSLVRASAIVALLVGIVYIGGPVVRLSAQQAASASAPAATESAWGIPIGYATGQPGSSMVLGPVLADANHLAATITVKNEADVATSSIALVAVVRGTSNARGPGPLAIVSSQPIAIAVSPGETRTIPVRFLSREQLAPATAKVGPPTMVFFGIERVAYANGADWSMAPNPSARTEWEALSLPPAQISRRLIAGAPRVGPREHVCAGEQGEQTSEGGVLAVAGEPGRMAVCRNGVWLDYLEAGASQPAPPSPPSGEKAPIPIKQVRPNYTKALMDTGTQGTVTVEITVTTEGKVSDAKVRKSLAPANDAEALRVAKQWEFTPGTKDGVPVAVRTELEFTFTLR
jgi:TonB family protein